MAGSNALIKKKSYTKNRQKKIDKMR